MRVFRVPDFLGAALMLGLLGNAAALRVPEPVMHSLAFDISHLLAGGLVLLSLMLLYQDRLYALLNVFALQAFVLALSISLAGLGPGCAASLRLCSHRAGGQGRCDSGGAAPHHRPSRHPPRD